MPSCRKIRPKHSLSLYCLYYLNEQKRTLDEFMDEKMDGIPLFRGLKVTGSAFFSLPLINSSIQIHTVYRSKDVSGDDDVVPEELAFYQTQLSTGPQSKDSIAI
jgi:hypothetical protein